MLDRATRAVNRASRSNSVAARIDFLILGATDYRHRATRMSQ